MTQRPNHHRTDHTTGLRRGWTTGACATAAARAACVALQTGQFPDPVTITLPSGQQVAFALCRQNLAQDGTGAMASVIKDAGDDPDVTHGAEVCASVVRTEPGRGLCFRAGVGVGTVTLPGLPIPPGEPAINPVPRQMIADNLRDLLPVALDLEVTLSIPGGEELAQGTWNARLGVVGGLSILGTTGVVVPFSCSSWIHAIHRGIDVARAGGRSHLAGCTGRHSEQMVQSLYGLEDGAMIDMGDFVGGMLKYLRRRPVPRLTIGGGFGKLTKLAMGCLDLHSRRSQVDLNWLAACIEDLCERGAGDLCAQVRQANTAQQVLEWCEARQIPLGQHIATLARDQALLLLGGEISVDVVLATRTGGIVARSPQSRGQG